MAVFKLLCKGSILLCFLICCCEGNKIENVKILESLRELELEENITDILIPIIVNNLPDEHNIKTSLLLYGDIPNEMYSKLSAANIDLVVTKALAENSTIDVSKYFKEEENLFRVGMCIFYVDSYDELALAALEVVLHHIYIMKDLKVIVFTKEKKDYELIFYLFYWYNIINCIIIDMQDNNQIYYTEYNSYAQYSPDKIQYGCWSQKNRNDLYGGEAKDFVFCNTTCLYMHEERSVEEAYFQRCLELTTKKIENEKVEVFPDKTKNLNGYPLFLMAVHTPPSLLVNESKEGLDKYNGKDANLMKLLGEKMNFTIKHRKALSRINMNPVFENIVTGYMELSLGMFDISSNIIFLSYYPFPPMDYIYPIEGGGLCFLTHRAGEIPMILNSLRVFKVEVFVLVAISVVILSCLVQVYLKQETNLNTLDRWGTSIGYIFRLFLSYPIPLKVKTDTFRFVIIATVWSTFALDYMIQSQMVYNLYTRPLKNQINTLKELCESGLMVEGFPSPDAMLPLTSEVNKKLNDRFASMDALLQCTDYLRTHDDKACWLECNIANNLARSYVDDSRKLAFHLGKEKNHDFYLVYPIPKGSPLIRRMTHYTKKIFECGLMKMWSEALLKAKHEDPPEVKAVSMKDFEGVFLNTLIFQLLITFIFVIEVLVGRCCTKKK